MGQEHAAIALGAATQGLPVAEGTVLVIDHRVVAEDVTIDGQGLVDHRADDAAGVAVLVDEDIFVLHDLEKVAVRVVEIEGGHAVGLGMYLGDVLVFGSHFGVVGGDVVGFDFGAEDPEVADLHVKVDRQGLALGILPDLEAAAALQVGRDAGVSFFGFVARLGQHPLGHRVILQHPDVHLEHVGIPLPRSDHILRAYTNLLNTRKLKVIHSNRF